MYGEDPNMDLETRFQLEQQRKARMEKIVKNPNYDEVYQIIKSLKPEEKSFLYPDTFGEFREPRFLVARQLYYALPNNISPNELSQMPEDMIRQIRLPVGFADATLMNPRNTIVAYLFVAITPQFRKKYVSPVLINSIIKDLKFKGFKKLILLANSISPCFNDIVKMAIRNKFTKERNTPDGKIMFSKKL